MLTRATRTTVGPARFAHATHGVRARHDPVSPRTHIQGDARLPGPTPRNRTWSSGTSTRHADHIRQSGKCRGAEAPRVVVVSTNFQRTPAYRDVHPGLSKRTCRVRGSVCECRPKPSFAVREQGFEPRFPGPEPGVLPLDDSRIFSFWSGERRTSPVRADSPVWSGQRDSNPPASDLQPRPLPGLPHYKTPKARKPPGLPGGWFVGGRYGLPGRIFIRLEHHRAPRAFSILAKPGCRADEAPAPGIAMANSRGSCPQTIGQLYLQKHLHHQPRNESHYIKARRAWQLFCACWLSTIEFRDRST